MPVDVEQLLVEAAAQPSRQLDVAALDHRRRRRRARRRTAGGAAAAVLVALTAIWVPRLTASQVAFAPADQPPADQASEASSAAPQADPGQRMVDAAALIGMWAVRDADDEAALLRLANDGLGGRLALLRQCGVLYGDWDADGHGLFVGAAGSSGSHWTVRDGCARNDTAPEWLHAAAAHRPDGQGHVLLDDAGAVVARLVPGDAPNFRLDVPKRIAEPPAVTKADKRALSASAPLPAKLTPATADALHGRWIPLNLPARSAAHAEFDPSGDWKGSDGCNGLGGRWTAGTAGALLATGGPTTLIGCDNVPVQTWLTQATRAGFDGDVLVLVDRHGNPTGRFTRP